MEILYESRNSTYKTPFGCLKQGEPCTIAIRIINCGYVGSVHLCITVEDRTYREIEMYKDGDFYRANFDIFDCGLYFYYFRVVADGRSVCVYKDRQGGSFDIDAQKWQFSCYPSWRDDEIAECFKGKIMYQIFPDRFNRVGFCDTADKIKPFSIHKNIHDTPLYLPDYNGDVQNNDFFGGNLEGIRVKLPYLKELHVGIIYLNPIFMAYSNHRYDTADYKRIDPLLGTEEDFKRLCDSAHELDIKILLDGVFSHTGDKSIYFDKENVFGGGAYNDRNSPYRQWYQFFTRLAKDGKVENDNDYTSWWGISTLPCVEELNESFLNYIIEGEDSVVAHWLNLGADGFRLDVADELPDEFIRRLHHRVHELKKEGLVLGEVWEDASNKVSYSVRRKYFTQGELDSVMNYVYKNAIIDFAKGNITAESFCETIMSIAENYPKSIFNCLMNSLSTHDTKRIINELAVDGDSLKRSQRAMYWMAEEELAYGIPKLYLAVFLQFVLPGNPCIYYGDEILMQGFEDPFSRRYFTWDRTNEDVFNFYKSITNMRNENKGLQTAEVNSTVLQEKVLSIKRSGGMEAVVCMDDSFAMDITGKEICLSHKASLQATQLVLEKHGFVLLKINSETETV